MSNLDQAFHQLFSPSWQDRESALELLSQHSWQEFSQYLRNCPVKTQVSAILQIYGQYQRWGEQGKNLLTLCWELSLEIRPMIVDLWPQFDLELAQKMALWLIDRPLNEPGISLSLDLLHRQNHPKAQLKAAELIAEQTLSPELSKSLIQLLLLSPQKRFLRLLMQEILAEPLSHKSLDFYGVLAHWAPKMDLSWKALANLCKQSELHKIHPLILNIFKSAGKRKVIQYFPLKQFSLGDPIYLDLCELHARLGGIRSLQELIAALIRLPRGTFYEQLYLLIAKAPIHLKAEILRKEVNKHPRADLVDLLGECRMDRDLELMVRLAKHSKEFSLQAAALHSLAKLGEDEADLFLLGQMQRSEAHAKCICTAFCEKLGEQRNWLYVQILHQKWPSDENIKQILLGALAQCPPDHILSSDLMDALGPYLEYSELKIRMFAVQILAQRPGHSSLQKLLSLHLAESNLKLRLHLEQALLRKIGPHFQLLQNWQSESELHFQHSLELLASSPLPMARKCEWLGLWCAYFTPEQKAELLMNICLSGQIELAVWWILREESLQTSLAKSEIQDLLSCFFFKPSDANSAWENVLKLDESILAFALNWFKQCPSLCKELLRLWSQSSHQGIKDSAHRTLMFMAEAKHG